MGDPFMAAGFGELKVFSGSAHPDLTREIAAFLGVSVGQARLRLGRMRAAAATQTHRQQRHHRGGSKSTGHNGGIGSPGIASTILTCIR